jgi:hypothetical protein
MRFDRPSCLAVDRQDILRTSGKSNHPIRVLSFGLSLAPTVGRVTSAALEKFGARSVSGSEKFGGMGDAEHGCPPVANGAGADRRYRRLSDDHLLHLRAFICQGIR